MNSIGVDFKLKNIYVDNHNIKLQIVKFSYTSGILLVRRGLEQLQLVTIKALKLL
jgi:hypothetical protein